MAASVLSPDCKIAPTTFRIGAISAVTLPPATSRFRVPEEPTWAGLMAFDSGALLVALLLSNDSEALFLRGPG